MDADTLKSMHELVAKHFEPTVLEVQEGHVVVAPGEMKVHDLDAIVQRNLPYTRRAKGRSQHDTLASLIAHANRFKSEESVAFCGARDGGRICVVYDYHPEEGPHGGRCEFIADYAFPYSTPWRRWTSKLGKQMSVKEFAELLEDGISDVSTWAEGSPTLPGVRYANGAELLTLAEGLTVRVEQRVVNQRKADNGTTTLVFSEEHSNEKGEPLRIPNGFLLGIPIFTGGPLYAVPVRLRYRIANGAVTWVLAMNNTERCLEDAIKEAAATFAKETGLPVFDGAPGSDR
jgi:uncharacterized protein YfdQ (DUF2303 family)